MTKKYLTIVVFVALVLIAGAFLGIFISGNLTPQILSVPGATDSDVLLDDSLLSRINSIRGQNHLPLLITKTSLSGAVKTKAENYAGEEATPKTTDSEIFDVFTDLSGDHYSTDALLQKWMQDDSKRAVLLNPNATLIGAWVAYYLKTSKSTPVPYIVVDIK